MDVKTLPKQLNPDRKYKQFTLSEKQFQSENNTEFFYIGNTTRKINFLVNTFHAGYAADTVEKAISILTRIITTSTIPDVILVDPSIGEVSLKQLSLFIADSKIYSAVPFILEGSDLSQDDLEKYRKLHFFDEIIFLDDQKKQQLKSTIEFLKKVKRPDFKQISRNNLKKTGDKYMESRNLSKRILDIVMSLMLIVVFSPLFLLIAIVIKLESKGPVLYVSKRAGRGYRIFNFFKFRTMVIDADKEVQSLSHLNHYHHNKQKEKGPVFFKVMNDNRITRVGAFLRNTSMDELPQFFNVLTGSMSLVGNRPLPLYEAAELTTDEWAERFMAPAGITGLWQIKRRKQADITMEERINLDIAYSKKYNFMYDLWIMAKTPSALIQKSNT